MFIPQPVSADIAIRGTATTNTNGFGGASLSISKPSGTIEGDVMIATIHKSNTSTPSSSGWTRINHTANNSSSLTTFYRVVTSGDSGTGNWTFSWSDSTFAAGGIISFSGVDGDVVVNANSANSGTGSTFTATGVTTTVDNTMLVVSYGATSSSIATASGMTERFDISNLSSANASGNTSIQTSAGSTGNKTSNNGSTIWKAHLVALTPAVYLFDQSAYRWFGNVDTTDFVSVTSNPSAAADQINSVALDTANNRLFLAGYDSNGSSTTPQWRIEKRKADTGELCSAIMCGTRFGSDGVLTQDVAGSADEKINSIAIDTSGGFMYLAGYDSAGTSASKQWRLEKRNLSDGSLVTSFGANGIITNSPTGFDDYATTIALDVSGGGMYVGGRDGASNGQWRIEKRNLSDGALVTAFNSTGVITSDFSTTSGKDEHVTSMVLDIGAGNLYAGGFDASQTGANNTGWRVEKRSMSTGALGSGFGNVSSGSCAANSAGSSVYCVDPGSGASTNDKVNTLAIDSTYLFISGVDTSGSGQWRVDRITLADNTTSAALISNNPTSGDDSITSMFSDGTNVYLAGYDAGVSPATTREWRYEKRTVGGALDTGFNSTGILTSDPTGGADQINALALDISGGHIYAAGYDSTGGNRWRTERRSLTSGASAWLLTGLAAQDTAISPVYATNSIVRLRLLLHNANTKLLSNDPALNFKLQYSPKSGTCDTGGVGEVYQDVTTGGSDLRFYAGNTSVTDGGGTGALTGDAAHSTHNTNPQSIETSNNFSTAGAIPRDEDALWDFVLQDFEAQGSFCFKVVKADGSDINGYNQMPEITFCDRAITSTAMRHGNFFCNGTERKFYWSR